MSLSARELRGQLIVLALALWAVAIVNATGPGRYLRSGQIKGTDFVQFYTLGRLVAHGELDRFADAERLREIQLSSVPESEPDYFPALYGPQVALALAPLGLLSYDAALVVWWALMVMVYLLAVVAATGSTRLRRQRGLVVIAAVAFPPFWLVIQNGHPTVVAVAVIVVAQAALAKDRRWLAGCALGLLSYKPPIVAPLVAVLLLAREWRMLAGIAVGALLPLLLAAAIAGPGVVSDYVHQLAGLPAQAPGLLTRPEQLQGWRGFWHLLLPRGPATVVFVAFAAGTVLIGSHGWLLIRSSRLRLSIVALTVVLASPHLYAYDLVLLAPVWLWLVDWFLGRRDLSAWVGRALYVGYIVALLGPLAAATRLQVSVPILAFLTWALWREGRVPAPEGAT